MREEAVPVELAGFRIPGPVRFLGIGEDDPRARIFLVGVAPDIPVARAGIPVAAAGALEPVVLVGGVVDDELGDDPQAALLGFLDEAPEILHRPEIGIDVAIVGDVVAVVAAGRGVERQQPQRGDAEILQVAQLLGQPGEIADAVIVAVGKGLDVELIDDGILVPELVADGLDGWHLPCSLRLAKSCRPDSADRRRRIERETPALELSTVCAFLFTVMPLPWKRRPHFACRKETFRTEIKSRSTDLVPLEPLTGASVRHRLSPSCIWTISRHPLDVACKPRAEWTFLLKPKPWESRPNSWTVRVTAV